MNRGAALAGLAAILFAFATASCASRPARAPFPPAGEPEAARSLESWRRAVVRADSLPPSRLLYDAKIKQGIATASGTLAISTAPPVQGTLAGAFGTPIATYANGVLAGEKLAPVEIEPEPLLALLAGVWRDGAPRVSGFRGGEALLAWADGGTGSISSVERVEAVLAVDEARFLSIRVDRRGRSFEAEYAGPVDPWPERVTLTDVKTRSTMRLVLQAKEPAR